MDLDLNEEQEMLREMVRGVCSSYASLETVRALEDDPIGYPPELHVDDGTFERGHVGTAVLRRHHEADQVELGHLLPQLGRVPDRVVLEFAQRLEARVRAANTADHLPQHFLFFVEVEIHR